jgi:hypothetical protein
MTGEMKAISDDILEHPVYQHTLYINTFATLNYRLQALLDDR